MVEISFEYCCRFHDKTKNDWDLRECFEKVPGKYDLLKMDYSGTPDEVDTKKDQEKLPKKKVFIFIFFLILITLQTGILD